MKQLHCKFSSKQKHFDVAVEKGLASNQDFISKWNTDKSSTFFFFAVPPTSISNCKKLAGRSADQRICPESAAENKHDGGEMGVIAEINVQCVTVASGGAAPQAKHF